MYIHVYIYIYSICIYIYIYDYIHIYIYIYTCFAGTPVIQPRLAICDLHLRPHCEDLLYVIAIIAVNSYYIR